jgi:hypothetical protein
MSNSSLHSSSGRAAALYPAEGGSSPSEGSNCLGCGGPLTRRHQKKYCGGRCQQDYQYRAYIERWVRGEETGLKESLGVVSGYVKRWLREKYGDACTLCGWSEVNPTTGKVPLDADHIDGDWTNNTPSNLRLLCGCCDSLQPTYRALNRGKGRTSRSSSFRQSPTS